MGQLSRRAAWAGFREPRKDQEEERQRPRSSAGKGVAVLSLRARTHGCPPGRECSSGPGATRRVVASPVPQFTRYRLISPELP